MDPKKKKQPSFTLDKWFELKQSRTGKLGEPDIQACNMEMWDFIFSDNL